jgi:hypothetical protein
LLGEITAKASPAFTALFGPSSNYPIDRYWSVDQAEWATDVMFKDPASLAAVYPGLVRHAMLNLSSDDVLRFLGKKVPASGRVHRGITAEVASDLKDRIEGVRVKHRVGVNSVKAYDKQGSVLRVETTINDARGFKVYRPSGGKDDKPDVPLAWLRLRKGVADMPRRAQVSQASNDRYLKALAAVDVKTPLKDLATPLCQPARSKVGKGGGATRRVRALNPLSTADAQLLSAVNRGEWAVNGFRNRDLRGLLYAGPAKDKQESKRRSGVVTRKLRLLHAHELIKKVPRTHRYQLTDRGRVAITALLAAREADAATLTKAA